MGKLILNKNLNLLISEVAFFGAIFASFFALLLNFFTPLDQNINTFFLIIVIALFIFKKESLSFPEIKIILTCVLFAFLIQLLDTVNRPDAYLYHLPYSQILNENKIIVGLSNLHFRFGHVSIIQYLSSFNYTYLTNESGILAPLASCWSLLIMYFLQDIFKVCKNKNEISLGKLYSLFILIYIFYKINRYGEFGNDAIGHLTIFYLLSKFIYLKKYDFEDFKLISLLSVFSILNKFFLILSIIFPLFILIKNKKINFFYPIKSLAFFLMIIWLFKNVLISGCIVYPVKSLCFEKLSWTDIQKIEKEQVSGEAWSKGWAQKKNKFITQKEFIKNYNWIKPWSDIQLKKILKNLFIYLLIISLISLYISDKKKNKSTNGKLFPVFIFSLCGSLLFFIKFPLYRYGYSYLIIFCIYIYSIIIINKINIRKFVLVCNIVLYGGITLLILKQFHRFYKFHDVRDVIPAIHLINIKNVSKIKISDEFNYYYSKDLCMYKFAPCTHIKPKIIFHKKKFGLQILYIK